MDTTSPLRSNILTISSSSPSPKAHHAPFSKTATNFIRTRNLTTQGTMHSTKSKSSASLAALLDVKQRRKIVESNARLLANRLIALSLEEKKIKSHTQMIHKRSDNLLAHRLNREQMKQERSAIMLTRGYGDKSFEEMRQTVTESKTQHMFELQKVKDAIYEERKKEALDVKNQTMKNHERFLESRQQKIDQLKSVYMKAKQEEANIPGTVKQARYDRLEPVRQIKYRIIATEQDKIKYRTQEIKKLDKMENSMLDLLHKAEKEDIKAVTQYNEISSFAVPDLMEKYKCYLSGQHRTKKFRSTFSHSRTNLTLMKSF